ncbi:tyrosine-type recombinase/integrase [Nocardia abscessus]|uniref:tyrosine-type recombinase/integrase n=1 Tax=Nocardia abscessus TaxID=120957 RepID=UPI00189344B1|nr:tyrosine-type recombinase/integrase [Nocardia abscessus]MBF6341635.1 tyrosine-type recombinase/integrase [Nocardia abscessus]
MTGGVAAADFRDGGVFGEQPGSDGGWAEEKELFRRWLAASMLASASQTTYLERAGAFLGWLKAAGAEYIDALSSQTGRDRAVAAYLSHLDVERGLASSTHNVSLAALDSYYTWRGLGKPQVAAVSVVRGVPATLTAWQRSRCLDEAATRSPRDYAVFVLLLKTGLRREELANLDEDDIHVDAVSGWVRAPGPGDTDRVIPLDAGTRRVQLTWAAARRKVLGRRKGTAFFLGHSGRRLSPRRVGEIVAEIGAAAGLASALSPGVLRNTFEQDLLLEGRELAEVAYLMGRSKPDRDKVRALRAASVPAGPQRRRPASGRSGAAVGAVEQLRMEF